jgi:hypothetical protein
MPMSLLFWMIYILSLIVGIWGYYEPTTPWFRRAGGYVALWVLVGLLGLRVFGDAIK